jgi:hypothetical protein
MTSRDAAPRAPRHAPQDLEPLLRRSFAAAGRVLVVGCGTSTLAEEMCGSGLCATTAIDIAESAIAAMRARAAARGMRAGVLVYERVRVGGGGGGSGVRPSHGAALTARARAARVPQMDAAKISFETGTFGGAVDKGLLDAVLSGGADGHKAALAILGEISRCVSRPRRRPAWRTDPPAWSGAACACPNRASYWCLRYRRTDTARC